VATLVSLVRGSPHLRPGLNRVWAVAAAGPGIAIAFIPAVPSLVDAAIALGCSRAVVLALRALPGEHLALLPTRFRPRPE
jgi:hypothetical protein